MLSNHNRSKVRGVMTMYNLSFIHLVGNDGQPVRAVITFTRSLIKWDVSPVPYKAQHGGYWTGGNRHTGQVPKAIADKYISMKGE